MVESTLTKVQTSNIKSPSPETQKAASTSVDEIMRPFVRASIPLFACDWTGQTRLFYSTAASVKELEEEIFQQWHVPCEEQMLSAASYDMQKMLLGSVKFAPQPMATIYIRIRCLGGKGGFGAMLRGQQSRPGLKKVAPNTGTLNFLKIRTISFLNFYAGAMRDLSGRRLRHVEQEQKLAEWVSNAEKRRAEKDLEKKEKRQKRWEETHEAAEKYVAVAKVDMTEISDAVRQGLEEEHRQKERRLQEKAAKEALAEKAVAKLDKLLGADSDSTSSNSDEDLPKESSKSPAVSTAQAPHPSSTKSSHSSSIAASSSNGAAQPPDGKTMASCATAAQTANNSHTPILSASSNTSKAASHTSATAKAANNTNQTPPPSSTKPSQIPPAANQARGGAPATITSASEGAGAQAPAPSSATTTAAAAAAAAAVAAPTAEPVDLDAFSSVEGLLALGGDRLKAALAVRGLKCGGTPQQRAERLWSVRGLPRDRWPAAALAPAAAAAAGGKGAGAGAGAGGGGGK